MFCALWSRFCGVGDQTSQFVHSFCNGKKDGGMQTCRDFEATIKHVLAAQQGRSQLGLSTNACGRVRPVTHIMDFSDTADCLLALRQPW